MELLFNVESHKIIGNY